MMAREVANYRSVENVHDLPGIFHYWSNKYLVPKYQEFGFSSPNSFYLQYMTLVCTKQHRLSSLHQLRRRKLRH